MAPYPQFLLFGDSLTQYASEQSNGFALGAALQNAYTRRLDVINRGFSGYNTSQAVAVLPRFFPTPDQAEVRFMTVFFGANDAALPSDAGSQHIPLAAYRQNLAAILGHAAVKLQNPRIILITPPPVDEHLLGEMESGRRARSRTAEHTKLYADAARELGASEGVVVLDLWSELMRRAGWQPGQPLIGSMASDKNAKLGAFFTDGLLAAPSLALSDDAQRAEQKLAGLHLTPKAYKVLFQCLMQTIEEHWPDDLPCRTPFVFPFWQQARAI